MPNELSAILVAEIGSTTTRVTLIDSVDGEARLIGQAAVPSTTEPAHANAALAIFEAAARISETTGRQLLQNGGLIMPQTSERDGVSDVVILTSAAGLMGVVIAAVSSDVSARSALHASRATYTTILQVVTLDTGRGTTGGDTAWIERQVQTLIGQQPDAIVITGGLEGGAEDSLVRLAHIVGLTALSSRVDSDGQQQQNLTARPVIFAGNSHARERVLAALAGRAHPIIVDNVRPALETERIEPARRAITQLYNERFLPQLPGAAELRRLSRTPIYSASDAAGLITRFVAERSGHATLTLDVGSATTALYLHSRGRYSPAVLGGVGTGFGLGALLSQSRLAAIARWLPFPTTEKDLAHKLLNKMLRPQLQPTTREDVLLDHAVAREAIAMAMEALRDERPDAPYNLVIASGGVLSNAPHPGLAALTILDALQPGDAETELAINLHLDALSLINACGALGFAAPDSAITLFERDLLLNTPLATCVVALGEGRPGEVAVEAELTPVGGTPQKITVQHGQIGRLPLSPGRTGTLTLQPAGGVRIGRNAPGDKVSSEVAAISGSALGVVIDARGRPLALPDEPAARQQQLWDWLVGLGVESGPLPYAAAVALPELPIAEPSLPANNITFVETPPGPAAPADDSDASLTLEHDLAKLRQTVEEPKKRGFLRRK